MTLPLQVVPGRDYWIHATLFRAPILPSNIGAGEIPDTSAIVQRVIEVDAGRRTMLLDTGVVQWRRNFYAE
jgi:hypothetical protein